MGIALDVWVNIDDDCPMKSEVSRTEAQLELGHDTGSLHLVVSEEGLARLVDLASEALKDMRAGTELGDKIDNGELCSTAYHDGLQSGLALTRIESGYKGLRNHVMNLRQKYAATSEYDPQAGEDEDLKTVKQQIDPQPPTP